METLNYYRDFERQPECFRKHERQAERIPEEIGKISGQPVILTGIATSLSAWKGAYALLSMQKIRPPLLKNTGDLLDYFFPLREDMRPLLVMSRSGDSAEIVRLMKEIQPGRQVVGITEEKDSALGKRANLLLRYAADEQAFQNTSSFTVSQMYALGVMIGLGYKPSKPWGQLLNVLADEAEDFCGIRNEDEQLKDIFSETNTILIDGQGTLTGVAEQYALDFQETRTAGISVVGGIMRHGVIELTEKAGVATIMLIPDDHAAERRFRLAGELWRQGKKVIIVTDSKPQKEINGYILKIPSVPVELKSIFFTLGMQKLFGTYLSVKGDLPQQPALVRKVTREE